MCIPDRHPIHVSDLTTVAKQLIRPPQPIGFPTHRVVLRFRDWFYALLWELPIDAVLAAERVALPLRGISQVLLGEVGDLDLHLFLRRFLSGCR